MTKRFAVIGFPVSHSLSPILFEHLFAQCGVDATYVARPVRPEDLGACLAEMRRGEWDGLSVTVPHKLAVRDLADEEDSLVQRIGAANTLVRSDSRISARNTDAEGCRRALAHAGVELTGSRVVILGAGGAARAGVFAALDAGASSVRIANRTPARADDLVRAVNDSRCTSIPLEIDPLQDALTQANVLIQSTTQGMMDDSKSPLPQGVKLPAGLAVHDMVYRPLYTKFLREAVDDGCHVIDGLWMLVFQALKQFELWTDIRPTDETALALHAHLRTEAS